MKLNTKGLLGLILWSQTLLLASTFRSWLAVVSAAALASVLVAARNRPSGGEGNASPGLPRWLGWVIVTLLIATTVFIIAIWRFANQIGDDINPVYVAVDILAHSAMFVSLIIWTLRPWRGHLAMLPLGFIVVLLAIAAGGASTSLAAQTTVALASCLGFSIGSQIILGSEQSTTQGLRLDRMHSSERSAWLAPMFSLLTLSILMMGTSVIANATNLVLPTIQNRLQEQLKSSFDAVGEQSVVGGTRYVRSGRIGSIRRHMIGNPREVALQVHCQVSPGYLRGNVFDLYRGGRWMDSGSAEFTQFRTSGLERDRNILPSGAGTVPLQRNINQTLQRFSLVDQSPLQTIPVEVHNDPMKGPMLFLPLATHWIEARGREIVVTNHGVVRLGVDTNRPYVAGVGTTLPTEQLSDTKREISLDVSPSILTVVQRTAETVCKSSSTAPAKATAISKYFNSQYSYSLQGIETPPGVDPLVHFLETQHDAHCEFFASATTLMLRSVGVPTRYVTGYVVDEPSDELAGLWVARNQDAHAWVEAFDEQTGRWFPVESTPGRTYQTVEPDQQAVVASDFFSGLLDRGDDENETWIGRVISYFVSMRATDPLLVLFRFTQLPLFLLLLFVLWNRYLKPSRNAGDPTDIQARKMLRQADRRLRSLALVRHPSETLYQFADRIDQVASVDSLPYRANAIERLTGTANWYRAYADARYQGRLPEPIR